MNQPLAQPENEKKFLPDPRELPPLRDGSDIFQFYLDLERLFISEAKLCYENSPIALLNSLSPAEQELMKIILNWPKRPTPRLRIRTHETQTKAFFTIKADSNFGTVDFSHDPPTFIPKSPAANNTDETLRQNLEFEREIEPQTAFLLLKNLKNEQKIIYKTRYFHPSPYSHPLEIDVFHGPLDHELGNIIADNRGLILIELEFAPTEKFDPQLLPPWIGKDVSSDKRYSNSSLSQTPYQSWK